MSLMVSARNAATPCRLRLQYLCTGSARGKGVGRGGRARGERREASGQRSERARNCPCERETMHVRAGGREGRRVRWSAIERGSSLTQRSHAMLSSVCGGPVPTLTSSRTQLQMHGHMGARAHCRHSRRPARCQTLRPARAATAQSAHMPQRCASASAQTHAPVKPHHTHTCSRRAQRR